VLQKKRDILKKSNPHSSKLASDTNNSDENLIMYPK
jgi:hypothetical protein